ncbi:beta-mannosidase [Lishizhenia tianjinensis]|uniref:beta-mannosidase n=1 Tax=Lishizhenia tianjinensis TaxID=477690 RepID=A0A1I6X909_9FLAO|nr:hypothetical protein [Lishizhenia tianjinensis]SFT34848.1 beta-mannosidase [Lishizhenia tianjinensis]
MVRNILLLLCLLPLCLKAQKVDTLVWNYQNLEPFSQGSLQYQVLKKFNKFLPYHLDQSLRYTSIENELAVLETTYNHTGGKAFLSCAKIATFCELKVNGKTVLHTNNYFHPWEIELTDYLKQGENQIEAHFIPAAKMELEEKYDYLHPAPNDEGEIEIASLVRKPQHMFGWDFAPRMNLIGFMAPVVISTQTELFKNPYVKTLSITANSAIIERSIELMASNDTEIVWRIEDEVRSLKSENGVLKWKDTLFNPVLWQAGEINELYEEQWSFTADSVRSTKKVRYGVRKVALIQTPDSLGTPFYFKLNNEFVFCKGSNVVPLDVFPEKVTPEKIRNLVLDAKEANMNMLRVWGGGDYLPEYFYTLCDSLGIMVWQDFMFACAMYPSDSSFLKSVQDEAVYQVKRLRQHPSVVYFNGNNEVDVAWKNWGFQGLEKYNLTASAQREIEAGYTKIFKGILKDVVHQHSNIPYEHTSPLSNWGSPENFNHGSMHYWGVWHGNDSLQEFWKQIGRFNAEFGFQSFPSVYALNQIESNSPLSLDNPNLQKRQKSYIGSAKIEDFIQREYGGFTDFSDFVYKSQLVQTKGVGGALIAHRLASPACGGSLFWQLNDCWEAPTWSAIDYYGERKALYYKAKVVFAPQTIVRDPSHPSDFYFLQDDIPPVNQVLELNYYSFDGKLLHRKDYPLLSSRKQEILVEEGVGDFLVISLGEKNFEFIVRDKEPNESDNASLEIISLNFDDEIGTGKLTFKVKSFVAHLQFYSEKYPLIFAENFKHFLPGEYTLSFEIRTAVDALDKETIKFHYIQP